MLKHIHLLFVVLALAGFLVRVTAAQIKPELLEHKLLKIGPHAINGLLILTWVALVFQGDWLSAEYGWIIAKIVVLLVYVALGLMALKLQGQQRWVAVGGALLCFIYIAKVAVAKNVFPFF